MNPIIFWDVTTQRDFVDPAGKLPVPGAAEIAARLGELAVLARARGILRVASILDHRLEDAEIALRNPDQRTTFPPHCLRGTPGQLPIAQTRPLAPLLIDSRPWPPGELEQRLAGHAGEFVLQTDRFDPFSNPNAERLVAWLDPRHVVVYGLPLEASGRFTVEGLLRRGRSVHLVRDAVRFFRPEDGARLLDEWSGHGVAVHETADLVAGGVLERVSAAVRGGLSSPDAGAFDTTGRPV